MSLSNAVAIVTVGSQWPRVHSDRVCSNSSRTSKLDLLSVTAVHRNGNSHPMWWWQIDNRFSSYVTDGNIGSEEVSEDRSRHVSFVPYIRHESVAGADTHVTAIRFTTYIIIFLILLSFFIFSLNQCSLRLCSLSLVKADINNYLFTLYIQRLFNWHSSLTFRAARPTTFRPTILSMLVVSAWKQLNLCLSLFTLALFSAHRGRALS